MKAARFHKTGPADVIQIDDVVDPIAAEGEVIVRVKAAALNRMDLFLRAGATRMPGFSLPHTGGFDIAGIVEKVGPGVSAVLIGQEVVVKPRITGPKARGSLDIIGTARPGGFAELVVAPAHCIAPKPKSYSFEEAAAFGCVYLTAYYGLCMIALLKPGETILVHAAGSGAGSAAIQVAKSCGATVITTAGSDEKCAKAKSQLGADFVVNYKKADFRETVREVTDGRGVDVVFDPVWGETATKTIESVARYGRWIVLGMVGGTHASIEAAKLLFQEITLRGIVEFYSDDRIIDGAWSLAHRGLVRPIVDKVWPLADLAMAHKQMEEGGFFGKIVVRP